MRGIITKVVINAVAIWIATLVVADVTVGERGGIGHRILSLLVVGALFGIVNAFIKPVLIFLTLPINLLTLGLFTFVINAALLCLTAWLAPGFAIASFWSALALAVIVAIVNAVVGHVFGEA